jgi:hypothetical protein
LSDRTRELAERQLELQRRCAAQRDSVAVEVGALQARFGAVDRLAGFARSTLLNPAVLAVGVVVLLTVGRAHGLKWIGRALLLSAAARRLVQALKSI